MVFAAVAPAPGHPFSERQAVASTSAQLAPDPRPNFVIVLTDDQRWDTIGSCTGVFDAYAATAGSSACMPFLQSDLMARGTTFRAGYATTALCCPSRASILTGQYALHHGINNDNGQPFKDESTLATWLDSAGYRTGLFGKYLNGYGLPPFPPGYIPPGWDAWHAFYGQGTGYASFSLLEKDEGGTPTQRSYDQRTSTSSAACAPGNNYSTDKLCAESIEFLQRDPTTPFFLYLAPLAPHLDPVPPARWRDVYADVTLPTYPNSNVAPSPDPPSWVPSAPLTPTQLANVARGFRLQLETARGVDDAVHAIYRELEASGRLANTVFVYTSDNGLARGEHRYGGKSCEFEECHRVPFVVVCPTGVCPGATARDDRSHFVLNIDIAPTIAALAGVTPGLPQDGSSLVPILNDAAAPWRTSFAIEDLLPNRERGVVSAHPDGSTYKYVELLDGAQVSLYNLTADPWELTNLAGDETHGGIRAALAEQLRLFRTLPAITLTGPAGATNSPTPAFSWTADRSATYQCRLDAAPLAPCGSGTSGSQAYGPLADGSHSFVLEALDSRNNRSSITRTFVVDTVPPTVSIKTPADDALLNSTAVKASWSARDDRAIGRYDLYERVGLNGTESVVSSSSAVSYGRLGAEGTTYCYRVVAYDTASNSAGTPQRCTAVPFDDRSADVAYAGPTMQSSDPAAYGATLSVLDGGGSATLSFNGRKLGILARKDSASGRAQIFVDGVLKATIDLYSAGTRNGTYVFTTTLGPGPHAVEVRAAGTKNSSSTGTSVALDGIAVIS